MATRYFALFFGVVYALIGVLGFFRVFETPVGADAPPLIVETGYALLFGLFPINILHNLVHLGTGLWGIASFGKFGASRFYARALAVIFGLLTIMGFFPVLQTTFGLIPLFGHDIWLHALTATAGVVFGWLVPAPTRARAL